MTCRSRTHLLLHDRSGGDFDNVVRSYTVNLAGEAADGMWQLEVRDVVGNVGGIGTWTLTLK